MSLIHSIDFLHAQIHDSRLVIIAAGKITSSGWTHGRLVPKTEGQVPDSGVIEFDFEADPPPLGGSSLQVILPIAAEYDWLKDINHVRSVKVNSQTNSSVDNVSGGTPHVTTFKIGEETLPPITTYAIGEEIPPIYTTYAMGEEHHNPSTMRLGEEHFPHTSPMVDDPAPDKFPGTTPFY